MFEFRIAKGKRGKWDTLEGVLNETWAMLNRGANRFTDPFHWPVLGTTGKDGPRLRTVILRQVRVPERMLVCHTDRRAPKVQEIFHSQDVSWLFYHPKKRVQLRISGPATLHSDDRFAQDQWDATTVTSRINYCADEPPGTPLDKPSTGIPDFLRNKVPTLLESEGGRDNFTAIACRIQVIDWLILRVTGNTSARFSWDENGLTSTWLIP